MKLRVTVPVLLAGAMMLNACTAQKKSAQHMNASTSSFPAFDKEGHRGARGLVPENTIPAMKKAIDLGVTTLEMDASITKDLQVILSHDPYINQDIATSPNGQPVTKDEAKKLIIYQMDYATVQKYDVGQRGNPRFPQQEKMAVTKPKLATVIAEAEKYAKEKHVTPLWYNIETKTNPKTDNVRHPEPAQFVALLMKVIEEGGIIDRTVIQSFDRRTLQVLHKTHPHVKTSYLIEDYNKNTLDQNLADLGFTPTVYSPHYSLVTPALVKACHDKNIKLVPWTVNDKEDIKKLKEMGVDGIITDYPNFYNELGM
ncbi:glycerophosphoryl diester phosphodiesterase [Chitinophaga skermanii]|uniref:Glycerophosphoryl diester phosphodiesterase n=1 Tax=Chitinophaga skermanii TaxID=331697 RepID=A0A327Q5L8_9BACT|nr:glycerophosphodiester phosphodiesterase [Chitinophaga skermanii]RAI99825.1 glycerophosphoryl diester phosphodiesterase [Chitinophaga skermanii]